MPNTTMILRPNLKLQCFKAQLKGLNNYTILNVIFKSPFLFHITSGLHASNFLIKRTTLSLNSGLSAQVPSILH